jgi:hypothetical protein
MNDPKFIPSSEMVRAIGPVTKHELETLRADRDRPAPTLELTPGGTTQQIIHKFEQERRTIRESYIENRLGRMEGRAENDFSMAQMRGKATHDFERSR